MPKLNSLLDKLKESFSSPGGSVVLILDLMLVLIAFLVFFKIAKNKVRLSILIGAYVGLILGYAICYIVGLEILLSLIEIALFWAFGSLIIVYSQDIKHFFEGHLVGGKINNVFNSKQEKDDVIKILCQAAKQLSDRSVGALITIEREDNLNSIIENAIPINSTITKEIITTIFTPGTACHDGAMIIRKDKIMCAGAYLPTTEKYDVPKYLGTRHRAAIGVSEKYDSVTIVVSEETGNISLTSEGVINLDLSIDRLEEMLDRFIANK